MGGGVILVKGERATKKKQKKYVCVLCGRLCKSRRFTTQEGRRDFCIIHVRPFWGRVEVDRSGGRKAFHHIIY